MHDNFVIHPHYSSLASKLKEALNSFPKNDDYVSKGPRNIIKKEIIVGNTYNIKKFKTPNVFQGLVYQFIRKSKAKRSFEYASKLTALGIKTPHPVAYLETFSFGLKESFYISEHLDYNYDFRELIHNPKFKKRNEILRQFTQFTFKLHENNVNFLDHSPGNTLIVEKENKNQYDFYLIDLNRMRFESMDFKKRMRNFRRLWLSKTMINAIAGEYAKLYGTTFGETHSLLTQYSRAFQKRVNSKKLLRRK